MGKESTLGREIGSIGRQSSIYMLGQVLSRAVGFVMIPVYTRYIAPSGYGAMELIEILTAGLGIFVSMGVADTMARFYYQEKEEYKRNRVVSTIVAGFALLAIPIVLLGVCLAPYIGGVLLDQPEHIFYLQVAMVSVWFGMFVEIGASYLRIRYKAKLFLTFSMGQLALALSLNILFIVHLGLGVLGFFYSTLIAQGITTVAYAIYIFSRVPIRHFSGPVFRDAIRFGLPIVPSRIALLFGFMSNRFFLKWMASPDPAVALAQVGLYSLGHKFGLVINRFVTSPFNSFWGPRRLDLLISEAPHALDTVARVCTYSTLATTSIALLVSVGAENLIDIMAAPEYGGAHVVVPIIALSYVALGLDTHFTSGILYAKKTIFTIYIALLSVAITIVANLLLVAPFGLIGAGFANLVGFSSRIVMSYLVSQRCLAIPFEKGRIILSLLLAIGVFLLTRFIQTPSPYATLVLRLAAASTYPVLLLACGFFEKGEITALRQILRRGVAVVRAARSRWLTSEGN